MTRNLSDGDLDKLRRLKAFAALSTLELTALIDVLAVADFEKYEVILRGTDLTSEAHILLTGIARITCRDARGRRVTVAMLAPGPIPEFPSLPLSRFDFRCLAYNDCRVGSLNWNDFGRIANHSSLAALRKFHENDLQHWYRLLRRSSAFLHLRLHERVSLTLLELCSDFGVKESRGTLLTESFSHKDIAELVGATRPRVTEHLARLEHDQLVLRQGHRLIVRVGELTESIAALVA
jgi:CRP-like cAMP-binding protein